MTEQEIQELQNKVLELTNANQTLTQEKATLEQEKETLSNANAQLIESNNSYKDMNAKLSLSIATSFTGATNPIDTTKTEEQTDEVVKSLDDIINELD